MGTLWSTARWGRERVADPIPAGWRSVFQQDYDRLLFSTPVRRLSDKTQVWPMEENDGVRTRLTHSHEVANLARSIGSKVAVKRPDLFGADLHSIVQPILLAIGLAHDLGNPPFGHQGEAAIGSWFEERKHWIFTHTDESASTGLDQAIPTELWTEFLKFDGNPQSFRLVTRLQTNIENAGLHLTAATLAALIKYPVGARTADPNSPVNKKCGYFESEAEIVSWLRAEGGPEEGQRHPLTWIMEACDDIAYSVLDVDDVMKKKIVSPDDVLAFLQHDDRSKGSAAVGLATKAFSRLHAASRDADVSRDIKIGYLRAFLIDELIDHASASFLAHSADIFALRQNSSLMDDSSLCAALQSVAKIHAFANPAVLKMEAIGGAALKGLLSFFWRAICERKSLDDLTSKRTSAIAKYGWSLVSPNYIEEAVKSGTKTAVPLSVRYRELRLLTDMISGMTDSFALKLWHEVRELPG